MKKILLSVGVVVIFAAYVFYQHAESQKAPSLSTTTQTASTQTPNSTPPLTSTPGTATTTITSPTPSAPATASGKFKDGSYTGAVADAVYGNIQVEAVISGGKLTDIQFLQYPNAPQHSVQVSSTALPQLKSEAIAAQSAQVDVVSGATQDSQAFTQSLQSALNQAAS